MARSFDRRGTPVGFRSSQTWLLLKTRPADHEAAHAWRRADADPGNSPTYYCTNQRPDSRYALTSIHPSPLPVAGSWRGSPGIHTRAGDISRPVRWPYQAPPLGPGPPVSSLQVSIRPSRRPETLVRPETRPGPGSAIVYAPILT